MNDNKSNLRQGSSLQGGKYVIEKTLGQGGFGITYLGLQVGLDRRVAIKEFFMKDYCERDSGTSHVTTGSQGSKKIVERFQTKFVKEAQTIAQLDNPHVIRIYDIFEENGTAYYVMEYIEGGSLEQYVNKRQRLDETSAVKFVGQIADALTYIHGKNILHLDVKPSNVLLRESGEAVLIDFGVSKHYDESGEQSSTTPVAISKGYAPIEQYTQGGISQFDPSTDIYSLGAVLYKLLTGDRPAEASALIYEGLTIPTYVSSRCSAVIRKAMSSKKSERYQSAADMKAALGAGGGVDEPTIIGPENENEKEKDIKVVKIDEPKPKPKRGLTFAACAIAMVIILVAAFFLFSKSDNSNTTNIVPIDTILSVIPDSLKSHNAQSSSSAGSGSSVRKEPEVTVNPTLTLSCKTSGASLYVDGKKKGIGKWSGELSASKHKVEARLEGYQTETETLDMSDGGSYSHTFPALTAVPTKSETTTSTVSNNTTSTASNGTINGHDYVDLGLSVKWATCNVGASSPTEYGNYYAWGETSTKSTYTEDNSRTYGKSMSDIAGNSSYDAARANWGGSWRLPTKAEFQELLDNCKSEWTTVSGVEGRRFTSKKNSKSIFLPAAGWCGWSSLYYAGEFGNYWSSTPNEKSNTNHLWFDDSDQDVDWDGRDYGLSVRPVSE